MNLPASLDVTWMDGITVLLAKLQYCLDFWYFSLVIKAVMLVRWCLCFVWYLLMVLQSS